MGIGDEVMATAEARHYYDVYGLPVVFANRKTRKVYWSEVFENNPKIIRHPEPGQEVCVVENHPGKRPYIKEVTPERFFYNPNFMIEPGELFLTDEEKSQGIRGAVIVEPHTKTEIGFSRNKAWPWERWQELVNTVNLPWVQLGPKGTKTLEGVRFVETESFRKALPYLDAMDLFVGADGAMHHTAAAFGKPAVVLWGGSSDPEIVGYKTHKNIRADVETCGSIKDCDHCRKAMEAITVTEVANAVLDLSQREETARHSP